MTPPALIGFLHLLGPRVSRLNVHRPDLSVHRPVLSFRANSGERLLLKRLTFNSQGAGGDQSKVSSRTFILICEENKERPSSTLMVIMEDTYQALPEERKDEAGLRVNAATLLLHELVYDNAATQRFFVLILAYYLGPLSYRRRTAPCSVTHIGRGPVRGSHQGRRHRRAAQRSHPPNFRFMASCSSTNSKN